MKNHFDLKKIFVKNEFYEISRLFSNNWEFGKILMSKNLLFQPSALGCVSANVILRPLFRHFS